MAIACGGSIRSTPAALTMNKSTCPPLRPDGQSPQAMVSDHVAPPFRIQGAAFRTVPKIVVGFREFDPFNCLERHGRGGEVWYSLK